jgi:hypothetical protein
VTFAKTPSFDRNPSFDINKLWNERKVSWNKIVKGIEILVLISFGVIYVKSMVK